MFGLEGLKTKKLGQVSRSLKVSHYRIIGLCINKALPTVTKVLWAILAVIDVFCHEYHLLRSCHGHVHVLRTRSQVRRWIPGRMYIYNYIDHLSNFD